MCRAGGRRCPNAGGRSTQNTRQAVSRARTALRRAKTTGDQAAIDTARQRLADARTAHQKAKNAVTHHHNEAQDHATDPTSTADVTPDTPTRRPSTQDTSGQGQDHDTTTTRNADHAPDREHGDTDQPRGTTHHGTSATFTVSNVNLATGNATVGSQHDVNGGDFTAHTTSTAGDGRDVTDLVNDALRRADEAVRRARHTGRDHRGDRHTTHNVADGTDHVDQQIGINLGTTRSTPERNTPPRNHHEPHDHATGPVAGADHDGDVTNPSGRGPVLRARHIVIDGDFHAGPTYDL